MGTSWGKMMRALAGIAALILLASHSHASPDAQDSWIEEDSAMSAAGRPKHQEITLSSKKPSFLSKWGARAKKLSPVNLYHRLRKKEAQTTHVGVHPPSEPPLRMGPSHAASMTPGAPVLVERAEEVEVFSKEAPFEVLSDATTEGEAEGEAEDETEVLSDATTEEEEEEQAEQEIGDQEEGEVSDADEGEAEDETATEEQGEAEDETATEEQGEAEDETATEEQGEAEDETATDEDEGDTTEGTESEELKEAEAEEKVVEEDEKKGVEEDSIRNQEAETTEMEDEREAAVGEEHLVEEGEESEAWPWAAARRLLGF